ncbi:MAG: hypothetical protein AB8G05_10170 [Oligoflexales bacterium]
MIVCPMCDASVHKLKTNSHVLLKWMKRQIMGRSGRVLKLDFSMNTEDVEQDLLKADIVCDRCENSFQKDDDYLAKIVLPENSSSVERRSIEIENYESGHECWAGLNFILFQRFVLGVILRMEFYQNIKNAT